MQVPQSLDLLNEEQENWDVSYDMIWGKEKKIAHTKQQKQQHIQWGLKILICKMKKGYLKFWTIPRSIVK